MPTGRAGLQSAGNAVQLQGPLQKIGMLRVDQLVRFRQENRAGREVFRVIGDFKGRMDRIFDIASSAWDGSHTRFVPFLPASSSHSASVYSG